MDFYPVIKPLNVKKGNKIFGIKFNISPVIFEKKINFSEYKKYIFPLSYLLDESIINQIKEAGHFNERINIVTQYFNGIVKKHMGSSQHIQIVTSILAGCNNTNNFTTPMEIFAKKYNISVRTLQRYFEAATSISSKKVLQIMRIRKAVHHLATFTKILSQA